MKSADLHAFFLAPFLDLAAEQLGEARVRELLEEQGIELELLRDPSAWLSMKDSERIVRTLHEAVGDPLYVARAARAAFTARYMGPLRAIIRAFGNTGKAYEQMVRSLPRFNKVGELGFEQVGPRHVRLTYRQKPGAAAETDPLMCLGRQQNMAAVPTIFDLPPAKLEHPECMHRGDDACVYEIRYVERLPKFRSRLALLLGAGAGVAAALTLELGPLALGVGTVLGAFASWALVRQWELRQELGESQRLVIEQQDALERSTLANEQRFGELLEAKSGVERKVKERTSELLETSARLQQTLDEVRDLAQAKTDFFANVSHELRTPLTLLLSPLEALRRGEAPPGGPEQALETMEANAKRLLRLINQLLDLAKVDAGRATVQRAPVDAGQLVHALVSPAQALAVTQGVALSVETPERSAPVALDPTWMETALGNLLANALRFAESAVTVRFRDAGGELVFEVEDDGPGVPAEDRERIFERFSQASDAARRRGGTGLGLALVQEAARLHGGRAELDEGAGGGALFRLVLPRIVASAPAEPVEARGAEPLPTPRQSGAPEELRSGPDANAPLALVVEDHPELRAFLTDVLAARYRVATAAHGRRGLERARELQPDVVVADVAMPELDGLGLTRALRADPKLRDVPILLVTARGEPSQVLEGFDAGADDYVVKPFHGRELLARLDVQLRIRGMLHRLAHQERLAALGVLAASVAHQVRNPLTALVSGLPAVRRKLTGKADARTDEMLEVFIDCANRIERISVDLLDLSRVDREEEGTLQPGQGLLAAVRLLSARVPDDVEVETDVDEETALEGRAGDLNHVFLNLVDNAARAVGDRGRVRIRGRVEGGRYRITVEDSGPGIEPSVLPRLFDPFVTSRPAGEGTGLGLSIAREIVSAHGGTIDADASPTLGGARFTVVLPLPEGSPRPSPGNTPSASAPRL